jgi:hypothetical protein
LIELHFESIEKSVKFPGLYHGPRNDLQLPRVEASDEVSVLLVLNYLLELESEPARIQWRRVGARRKIYLLLHHFIFVRVDDILYNGSMNGHITQHCTKRCHLDYDSKR